MPVHVFLDQRSKINSHEDSFNIIGHREGYIMLDKYYTFLQELISTQQVMMGNNIIEMENNTKQDH
ncbi:MAG: hypothetical protein J7M01_00775 [Candidatus Marinimicrobia bacterium]|nr:hypothetical protein [Candidatus Neomarinimicrobiota bacterium]